ncbi:MAG: Piwi domain-containing protein [Syntrophobacteraceae bacterium]
MQDIRLNWFRAIFSKTRFELAARLRRENESPENEYEFGAYALRRSPDHEQYPHFMISLTGKTPEQLNTVEQNAEGEHVPDGKDRFRVKAISITENSNLTLRLISVGLQRVFSENGFHVKPDFSGINVFKPSDEIQYSHYVRGVRTFHIVPHYLKAEDAYGVIINTRFSVQFRKSFSDPLIKKLFQNELIVADVSNRRFTGKITDIYGDNAIIIDKQGIKREFALSDISPIYNASVSSKYSSELRLPPNMTKLIQIESASLDRFGNENTFIYAASLNFIEDFVANNKHIFKKFRLPVISDMSTTIDTNFTPLQTFGVQPRIYEFDTSGQCSDFAQYRGIQKYGPLKFSDVKYPRFIFVFDKRDKDLANKLYLSLKNGIGTFPGLKKFFGIEITKEALIGIRVDLDTIPEHDHESAATAFSSTILNKIIGISKDKDAFAFLIIPKTPYYIDPSPYYSCKAVLLQNGIPSQGIDRSLIMSEDNFKWAVANIALATFVKLGGLPWRIKAGPKKDLIMGVGRSDIYDASMNFIERVVGYTILFGPDGTFLSFHVMPPAKRSDYFESLKSAVELSLRQQLQKDDNIERIVIHFSKRSGKKEISAVESGIRRVFKDGPILPFILIRISKEDSFQAYDFSHNTKTPLEGTYIKIASQDALVWLEGRPHNRPISKRPSKPFRISIEGTNVQVNENDFDLLIKDVYNLAGANWRGFNAKAKPITIYYSQLVAEFMNHLFHNKELCLTKDLHLDENTPWFI